MHTPGTWFVTGDSTVVGPNGNVIAECYGYSVKSPDPAQRAQGGREDNARLIKEAPKLVKILREALSALEDHVASEAKRAGVSVDECCPCHQTTIRTARELLARIDGENA